MPVPHLFQTPEDFEHELLEYAFWRNVLETLVLPKYISLALRSAASSISNMRGKYLLQVAKRVEVENVRALSAATALLDEVDSAESDVAYIYRPLSNALMSIDAASTAVEVLDQFDKGLANLCEVPSLIEKSVYCSLDAAESAAIVANGKAWTINVATESPSVVSVAAIAKGYKNARKLKADLLREYAQDVRKLSIEITFGNEALWPILCWYKETGRI